MDPTADLTPYSEHSPISQHQSICIVFHEVSWSLNTSVWAGPLLTWKDVPQYIRWVIVYRTYQLNTFRTTDPLIFGLKSFRTTGLYTTLHGTKFGWYFVIRDVTSGFGVSRNILPQRKKQFELKSLLRNVFPYSTHDVQCIYSITTNRNDNNSKHKNCTH